LNARRTFGGRCCFGAAFRFNWDAHSRISMSFQNHSAIPQYQATLARLKKEGHVTEEQTRAAFERLLTDLSSERGLFFTREHRVGVRQNRKIDGVVKDGYSPIGYWEAKDANDKLEDEIQKKIALEYPTSNTIFEDTQHAILYQHRKFAGKFDLSKREEIGELLDRFFGYTEADAKGFADAVKNFIGRIPELAQALAKKIEDERDNEVFKKAFNTFFVVCQTALNPQIKESAVKEMLVQHLLTERLFKGVFDNEKWFAGNIIAQEIDSVIDALASRAWNRADFLKRLDPLFNVIEERAHTLPDYAAKQDFLDTVYEQFLKVYSPDTADTMGIVYTPQPIVDWMCASVDKVLASEFGHSLSTPGVKLLDPCTGTGNFVVNLMRRIPKHLLPQKYKDDLFANEIMLLPYYVASGNIEHEYFDIYGQHAPFEGLCFQDTLDLSSAAQTAMFAERNTERIARQKAAELTVIIGNPPYNVGQKNENDNNKNREYKGRKNEPGVDDLIRATYAKSSRATLQNKLYDPYVRFFKWAEERLGERDGIICFVSNNSFLDQHAFDGMRKELAGEFNHIWHLDLHGNVRRNPKLSGTTHNVFGIQVGVGITILVRNRASSERFIRYFRVPEWARRSEKLDWLDEVKDVEGIEWQTLAPNAKNAWLTEGLVEDFESFAPMGTKEAKASFSADTRAIFKSYSLGVATNRDEWCYDWQEAGLRKKIADFIANYNSEVIRYEAKKPKPEIDNFVNNEASFLKWTDRLKEALKKKHKLTFDDSVVRHSMYRPFVNQFLYFDELLNQRRYQQHRFFPKLESKNLVICLSGIAHSKSFHCLMVDAIPGLDLIEKTQCFPLYTFSADGSERFDNISGWALDAVRAQFGEAVSREDVFYATYALLHHPAYRAKYAENLKRELPRLPLAALAVSPQGWASLGRIGRELGDLHVGYEGAKPFALDVRDTTPEGKSYSFRVEKMRWNKEKTALKVNDSIELSGFSPAMFDYKLGNRSALDWVVESYRVKHDERSGLTSDPNREEQPNFILDLIGKVATVSLETQRLVGELPELFPPQG